MAGLHANPTVNLSRVLRLIWHEGVISRVMIARHLGLDKSTVTDIVSKLLATGIVNADSQGKASPQGGRRPVYLAINKNFGVVAGFELQPDSYKIVVVNLHGEILLSRSENISVSRENLEKVALELLSWTEAECRKVGRQLLGAAFGTTGIIDPQEGRITFSIPFRISEGYPFVAELAKHSELPVFVENDANCCAWGELAFHKKSTLNNFLYVLVEFRERSLSKIYDGVSVGMGFVLNGRVYHGNDFSAGEWRSAFCTRSDGGQLGLMDIEPWDIPRDSKALKQFICELSKNIALLVNTLNLNQVFLGGVLKKYEELVTPTLREEIYLNWPYKNLLSLQCSIHYSSVGENAVAYGAAGMVLERLFGIPEIYDRKNMLSRSRIKLLRALDRVSQLNAPSGAAPRGSVAPLN